MFFEEHSPITNYDAILHVFDIECFKELEPVIDANQARKFQGFFEYNVIKVITNTLKQALNKRVKQIVPLDSIPDDPDNFKEIRFGINLDTEHAFSQIEKGPEANTLEAREFRDFWGDLSSLRRFKDGSICEAVFFDTKTVQERRFIFAQIIEFVFSKKLDLSYRLFGDQLESEIKLENIKASFPIGTNEDASLKVKQIYDKFAQIVRNLEGPLYISAMQGSSDVFSYTDPYPPIPTTFKVGKRLTEAHRNFLVLKNDGNLGMVPRYVAPIECVFNLTQSSKWPDDLEVVRALILQLYFHFQEYLLKNHKTESIVTEKYIDVFYEGLVFRLKLYQQKEVILLKKNVNSLGVVSYKDNMESFLLERDLHYLPILQGALNGLHLQNSCYGPSTALVKKWIRSHMIDEYHISDMAINLLNAHLFLKAGTNLCLPQAAFCRFLHFISTTNFQLQLIDVNFNDLIGNEQLRGIENKFMKNRNAYPTLYIVTPYDNEKSLFTIGAPTKEILNRLSILARSAITDISHFEKNIYKRVDMKESFTPNYQGYHALIQLKPLLNPRRYQSSQHKSNHTTELPDYDEKESKIPVIGFNPVEEYLKSLRTIYRNVALFFHDSYGGNTIGLLWIPSPTLKHEHQKEDPMAEGCSFDGSKINCNKKEILNNIHELGKGLVKNIEIF